MSKRESIARYNLIIKKLRKTPSNFNEISEYLAFESDFQGYDFNVSKRTFQRDLEDIRSLYNIDIQYDYSKKVYQIADNDQPEVYERIMEAFDTFNALNINDRISDHIHFEKRKPHGTENLYGFLHAIKKKKQVNFIYCKYWDDKQTVRQVSPYALKEFRNRWYVLAMDKKDKQIKSFALDRLRDLVITNLDFETHMNFNVNEHYKHCFGIISPNAEQPEEVELSFEPFQGKYIKSLPLHETQKILIDDENELRIRLKLYITHDLVMELLSYGDSLKVIQPDNLAANLKSQFSRAASYYK